MIKTHFTSEPLNENWTEQKEKLLERFSILHETDLLYIDGKKDEMLDKVRTILGTTREELRNILKKNTPYSD